MKLLKEWAIVCRALDDGRQIFIARKGGIAEEEGEFVLQDRAFFLWPVTLHQNREALKPSMHLELDLIASSEPKDGKIHLKNYAVVTDSWKIQDFNILKSLDREHIWDETLFRQRFEWGNELGLHLIVLKVYRLLEEIVIPMKKEYGGCRSWVTVEKQVKIPRMFPALSDAEFSDKRSRLKSLLLP